VVSRCSGCGSPPRGEITIQEALEAPDVVRELLLDAAAQGGVQHRPGTLLRVHDMEPPSKPSPGAIASDHEAPEATKRRAGVGGRCPQDVAERGVADRFVGIHDPELRFVFGIDLKEFENMVICARCVPDQVVMHNHTHAFGAESVDMSTCAW